MRASAILLLVLVTLLIAGRIYLPVWVTNYVDRSLDSVSGYQGSVEDVDLNLYRGAYKIHNLKMTKTENDIPVPFLDIATADLSIQWGALLDGKVVGDVELIGPTANFVLAVSDPEAAEQVGEGADWVAALQSLMPIQINKFTVRNGTVFYRDFTSEPRVNVALENLQITAENLSNVEAEGSELPSTIEATATAQGGGMLQLTGNANLLKTIPEFDVTASAENVPLTALNDFAKAYAQLDFEAGTLHVYSEMAVADGILEGYLKPLLVDVQVVDLSADSGQPLEMIWEMLTGFVAELLENQPRDQIATTIPLTGDLSNVQSSVWSAIGGILRNAFIEALQRGPDHSVSIEDVEKDKEKPQ